MDTRSGLRLNLGCGGNAPEGWVNLDRSPGILVAKVPMLRSVLKAMGLLRGPQAEAVWPANARRWDVTKGLPYEAGSVDAIYSQYMLEHLPRKAAEDLIRECARVLRQSGLLRISVPDLRLWAEAYVASPDDEAADEFMRSAELGREQAPTGLARLVAAVSGAHHQWAYDARSLSALLRRSGFVPVRVCEYQQGEFPDLERVERNKGGIFLEAAR